MMNVSMEAAYAEACQALGESIVTQRLLAAELERALTPQAEDAQDAERHAGTLEDPDPCPPMGETRVQHC